MFEFVLKRLCSGKVWVKTLATSRASTAAAAIVQDELSLGCLEGWFGALVAEEGT